MNLMQKVDKLMNEADLGSYNFCPDRDNDIQEGYVAFNMNSNCLEEDTEDDLAQKTFEAFLIYVGSLKMLALRKDYTFRCNTSVTSIIGKEADNTIFDGSNILRPLKNQKIPN